MARGDAGGIAPVTMSIDQFLGQNTAVQFSQIDVRQSPSMVNLLPGATGSLANRKGTVPVTVEATENLKRLFTFRKSSVDNIVASGGTTLYKFNTGTLVWDAQTMTDALNTDLITSVQFRDQANNEVMVIADGGNLKFYDGTAVTDITPAPDDTSPAPANILGTTINTTNPAAGVTLHNNRMVIWSNQKDIIFHSKPGYYDYFPSTNFQRFVRNNDYIQTCISFGSAMLVFMRNSIGVLFGDGYGPTPQPGVDWTQDFLDTTEGCVNPRSVRVVVFPDSHEEVFYQTDRGISSVMTVNTKSLDNSTAYATRNVTNDKINWESLGVTNEEWAAATSYFWNGFYWIVFKRGSEWVGLVYDTDSNEWFPIQGVRANDFYADSNAFYMLGSDATQGHLVKFDEIEYDTPSITTSVVQDYDSATKTIGTPVIWNWYSKLLNPGLSGFKHLWDILLIECKQFASYSSIDVEVNALQGQYNVVGAIKSSIMIIGFSIIGEAEIANLNFTEFINNAKRLRIFLKSQYIQIKLSNSLGQPVELFNLRVEVRPQNYLG